MGPGPRQNSKTRRRRENEPESLSSYGATSATSTASNTRSAAAITDPTPRPELPARKRSHKQKVTALSGDTTESTRDPDLPGDDEDSTVEENPKEEDEEDEEEDDNEDDSKNKVRFRGKHRRQQQKQKQGSNSNDDEDDDEEYENDTASMNSTEREMTLKDRQEQMNKRHPFGLPIWKPALYKKSRSVVRKANSALHSSPTSSPELFLNPGNLLWLLLFGWWLALVIFVISVLLMLVPPDGYKYGLVLRELALYLLWPFGRYVERHGEESDDTIRPFSETSSLSSIASLEEDDEEQALLVHGAHHTPRKSRRKRSALRAFVDICKTGPAGCVYYLFFFFVAAPLMMLVSATCWMFVITIPMAKLNYLLVRHLRRHPLSLRFKSSPSGQAMMQQTGRPVVILLCTYQAIGLQYYKYTYEGINIMFINLMPLVFFVILDEYALKHYFPDASFTSPAVVFALSLASVIPLSYFIGMGVSSVSAQSSMGIGAFLNASFGSIIEIILYAVALTSGKSLLVEGALIGSFLAGVLLMPGCSMISGGIQRKEQKFNAKSAEVTSTMLIMAIIGALTPTLFYQMFGSFEMRCAGCPSTVGDPAAEAGTIACSRCYYDQMNPTIDPVYQNSVKPLMWFCAAILPSAYVIGIVFSLHTHVDMVWDKQHDKKPPTGLAYYQKLMPGHIISHLVHHPQEQADYQPNEAIPFSPSHVMAVPVPSSSNDTGTPPPNKAGLPSPVVTSSPQNPPEETILPTPVAFVHAREPEEEDEEEEAAGHDSPNWSKTKSFTILFGCTLLYSIIAEILVDTVDEVMDNLAVDEKFLGLTLFALVPNITEFMNAISFALYGNIVLSMEIGSAYALQVCLLQIPAMVAISLWVNWGKEELANYTFSLTFPRWDVISVIFSVFLLTYTYQEGKSNYFKGSILIMSYCVLVAGFYFIPPFTEKSILVGVGPTQ